MIKKIKKVVWQVLNAIKLGGAVQLMLQSALTENGWFRSFHTKQSVDKFGNPIPWVSYPFIHFITPRLTKQMEIFEFGCGNSTLWYASRVKQVKSVEHDEAWARAMQPKLPANAIVVFRKLSDTNEYPAEVRMEGKRYHIVIIDGRQRNRCAIEAVDCLTTDGVIVWDNSERPDYHPTIEQLLQLNFKKIDFWGMCPISNHLTCTTVFYKNHNCLNI